MNWWQIIPIRYLGWLGFFVRVQPKFCYDRNWHVPIYSARKTLAQIAKKILLTDIDKKKWPSTSAWKDERSGSKKEASSDDADRTFPNRHHANFVHALNWKHNSRHRLWKSRRGWFFSAEMVQFLFKKPRWQILFFLRQWKFSCFGVAYKCTM